MRLFSRITSHLRALVRVRRARAAHQRFDIYTMILTQCAVCAPRFGYLGQEMRPLQHALLRAGLPGAALERGWP